ncbi:competence type IV pilus major pilin ComGC [Lactiplantibacillus carotarum]|uniref:competence type IV pilus major pilin ComGC n=1 Tax=Lactiplantibacillus carotarum TaxID=2993456 RepID=UPI00298EE00C|nr:competence type IV pilus major pilin ComGC [Lactiplantibacillus carotarum]
MNSVLKRLLRKTTAPREGFTLLEMVIVLGIIALLMLIIIPNLDTQRKNAEVRSDTALREVVYNQAEMYANDHNKNVQDVSLSDLQSGKYLNAQQYSQASTKDFKTQRPEKETNNVH